MPTRNLTAPSSLLPSKQERAQFIHQQHQAAILGLNRRYAGKLTPTQMAHIQMLHPTSTDIAPGAGMPPNARPLVAPTQEAPRPLTI